MKNAGFLNPQYMGYNLYNVISPKNEGFTWVPITSSIWRFIDQLSGWWQLKYFLCSPRKLGKIPILTSIFFSNGLKPPTNQVFGGLSTGFFLLVNDVNNPYGSKDPLLGHWVGAISGGGDTLDPYQSPFVFFLLLRIGLFFPEKTWGAHPITTETHPKNTAGRWWLWPTTFESADFFLKWLVKKNTNSSYLAGGFSPTHLNKYARQIGSFPQVGENKTYLKPPIILTNQHNPLLKTKSLLWNLMVASDTDVSLCPKKRIRTRSDLLRGDGIKVIKTHQFNCNGGSGFLG